MKYIFFFIILFNFSCAKQKSVLICGDHMCVNKAEAKQFFEDNLTIEVQIISNDKKSSYDLVDLNISGEEPKIKIFKNNNKKIVKKLSKKEIKEKKAQLKKIKKESKLETKKTKIIKTEQQTNIKNIQENGALQKKNSSEIISSYNTKNNSIDICLKLKKCDIDSITSYLIKASKEKDFPNISLRE